MGKEKLKAYTLEVSVARGCVYFHHFKIKVRFHSLRECIKYVISKGYSPVGRYKIPHSFAKGEELRTYYQVYIECKYPPKKERLVEVISLW